jgi:hypothetical protein
MQESFSRKNFVVSSSASNPGDGVLEVVLSLSHQRGKKLKPNQTKQNNAKQTNKQTKKPHKMSQVEMQYSFSKFFSLQL